MDFELQENTSGTEISEELVSRFLNTLNSEVHSLSDIEYPVITNNTVNNLGTLLFSTAPEKSIPGARCVISKFLDDRSHVSERIEIKGSVLNQYHKTLEYLLHLTTTKNGGYSPFNYTQLNGEIIYALINRSYEDERPITIDILPTHIQIQYPQKETVKNPSLETIFTDLGLIPEKSVDHQTLQEDVTGVYLPGHELYVRESVIQASATLWANAKKRQAINYLRTVFNNFPYLEQVANQLIEYSFILGNEKIAKKVMYEYSQYTGREKSVQPYITMSKLYISQGKQQLAKKNLQNLPPFKDLNELLTVAILKKKLYDFQSAHHIFKQFYTQYSNEPQFLHEFSQIKIKLTFNTDPNIKASLYQEAEQLLRQAISLGTIDTQKAWYWFDLAKLLIATKQTEEIEASFKKAIELLPRESLFVRSYNSWLKTKK